MAWTTRMESSQSSFSKHTESCSGSAKRTIPNHLRSQLIVHGPCRGYSFEVDLTETLVNLMKISGAQEMSFSAWKDRLPDFMANPGNRSDAVTQALASLNKFCSLQGNLLPDIDDLLKKHLSCGEEMFLHSKALVNETLDA